MPLLYGEGCKAFMRLQLEIIRKSDDESIFAWTSSSHSSGMLAPWPDSFLRSGSVRYEPVADRPPYIMTNKGLEMNIAERHIKSRGSQISYPLACCQYRVEKSLDFVVDLAKRGQLNS